MATYLGLDIGSNSVGSAWVDTRTGEIALGVSVFPAGVEESDTKRGAPKNQARRQKRSQRRSIRRRAQRKQRLRQVLTDAGLLPTDADALDALMCQDPWMLRREGLDRSLTPHEFGRVLLHLAQRRGALGIESDGENDEGKVKKAIEQAKKSLQECGARTFGEMMAILRDERRHPTPKGKYYDDAIRNRRDSFEFHADRALIRDEFNKLWEKQRELGGELASLLTEDLRLSLDDDKGNKTWQHKGALFGQRRTYWDTGTLGRCDLEPSDRRCPIGDRHAQAFRVLETVNNVRIQSRGEQERPLNNEEREKLLAALRKQKTGSPATLRRALGINTKDLKEFYSLNVERDPDREINTDWFYREIVHGVLGEEAWSRLGEGQKDSVNRALLKFDPDLPEHVEKLRTGAAGWWGLDAQSTERLIQTWKLRPNPDKRLSLSRRVILNLLPYMERGLTVTEARQRFAEDPDSPATPEQRARYAFTVNRKVRDAIAIVTGPARAEALLQQRGTSGAERRFLAKHPDTLPPPPTLANPVVRKAIYEVRRHVNAYLRRFGRKPDRVVIEMARETRQSAKVRNAILSGNRKREKIRKEIIKDFGLDALSENQQRAATERVLLCRQQREICPYTGAHITPRQAADGDGCEVDHIIPRSRGGDNGLNNLVLAERGANREKGNHTPREWLDEEDFGKLLQRMGHMEKPSNDACFHKKDFKRKWDNLNRRMSEEDERRWLESQLSDTAYASRQVADYLQGALYSDAPPHKRQIFFTKGRYTAMLRRDWQLYETGPMDTGAGAEDGRPRLSKKDRTDHRHHAVDAAVIALTGPKTIEQAASAYAWQEANRSADGRWPKRPPIAVPAPWTSVEGLRNAIIRPIFGDRDGNGGLVVSHRPVKRRLVGALHEATIYGVADFDKNSFTTRVPVENLTPKMLRPAKPVQDKSGQVAFADPELGTGGLVRDRELRRILRDRIAAAGTDPEQFSKKEIQQLARDAKLRMPSGVPIKAVTLLRRISDPVIIEAPGKPTRVYVGGNNHHMEIIESEKTGTWAGRCVTMFEAARRVRPPKGTAPVPLVKKDHAPGKRFVMSLAEGETIHSRRQDRPKETATYYIVAKLRNNRIFLKAHTDARPVSARADQPEKGQDRWSVSPAGLKNLGPKPDVPPYKVRVSALGEVERMTKD